MTWTWKVNIKKYLSEDTSKAAIQAAFEGITKELKSVPLKLPREWSHYARKAIKEEDANLFNLGLQYLYDWADANRVWMGI